MNKGGARKKLNFWRGKALQSALAGSCCFEYASLFTDSLYLIELTDKRLMLLGNERLDQLLACLLACLLTCLLAADRLGHRLGSYKCWSGSLRSISQRINLLHQLIRSQPLEEQNRQQALDPPRRGSSCCRREQQASFGRTWNHRDSRRVSQTNRSAHMEAACIEHTAETSHIRRSSIQ